jgi:hypothetical protein
MSTPTTTPITIPILRRMPQVGDQIYVPTKMTEELHVLGGVATVTAVAGPSYMRSVSVAEHEDVAYLWRTIKPLQRDLAAEFGLRPARMPTPDERAQLTAQLKIEAERRAAQREAAERAQRERWEPKKLAVLNGALIERPIYEEHPRKREWVAVITYDPKIAGGIDRFWFNRATGPVTAYIVPATLVVGDAIEFGADYIRYSGFRDPGRWYGVVLEVTREYLLLQPCADAMAAFKLSAAKSKP